MVLLFFTIKDFNAVQKKNLHKHIGMTQKNCLATISVRLYSSILLVIILMAGSCTSQEKNKRSSKGFVSIFDGKTLTNWKGDATYWRVENGNLVGEITPSTLLKTNSFIIWQGGKPADFELTLEFKISSAGNSGINYRSEQLADVPNALKGYQADID